MQVKAKMQIEELPFTVKSMENGAGMKTVIRKRMGNMKAKSEKGNRMGKAHTLSTVELKVKYCCSHS